MIIRDIIEILEKIAPKRFAEPDDPVGLQIGSESSEVKSIAVALDGDCSVLEKAADSDLLILHHPVIYRPISKIDPLSLTGSAVCSAVKNDLAVFVMHSNFDCASPGVSDYLAEKLGVSVESVLAARGCEPAYKLIVFAPRDHFQAIISAMSEAGAGIIANYSACTFRSPGIGTFRPEEGASPFIGGIGNLEEVEEYRVETIVRPEILNDVIKAVKRVHPYEEPAYDVYELSSGGREYGLGRFGVISPSSVEDFFAETKQRLNVPDARLYGPKKKSVTRIAVCGGAGGSLVPDAIKAGAEVFVTGDVGYHYRLLAEYHGLSVIDAGHRETELPAIEALASILKSSLSESGIEVKTAG